MSTTARPLFMPLTISTAPDSSKPILEKMMTFGVIPNLMAMFANIPTVLRGYRDPESVWEDGSFPPRERQLILLAASVENQCSYCIAAHSTILKTLRIPVEIVFAIRQVIPVPDAKLNELVTHVGELIRGRGNLREQAIENFIAAGYRKEQVIELLIRIALKTISNYLDHISPVPVDSVFAAESK